MAFLKSGLQRLRGAQSRNSDELHARVPQAKHSQQLNQKEAAVQNAEQLQNGAHLQDAAQLTIWFVFYSDSDARIFLDANRLL